MKADGTLFFARISCTKKRLGVFLETLRRMHAKAKMFSRKRLSVSPERPRRISESVNALSDTKKPALLLFPTWSAGCKFKL